MFIGQLMNTLRGQTVKQLRKKGAIIGENVELVNCMIDKYTAFLVEIGDNSVITNATILAHDGSTKRYLGYTRIQKTVIGSNVFVGMGSIVLAGSHIGNNVIVGAGSIVRGDIPDNSVVMGNPARVVYSLDEYIAMNRDSMENGYICEKMCSAMPLNELIDLREKLGDDLGFEL